MKIRRHLITLGFLSLLSAAIIGCGAGNGPAGQAGDDAQILTVRVQPVDSREFEQRITVQGALQTKNFANVAARADGNLDAVWVDEGDPVVAGKTPLFQVDYINRENALTIARQDIEVARAALTVARATAERVQTEARKAMLDFERYERLHRDGRVSDNEFELRSVNNEQARAGVAVARAQVDLAERQLKQAEAALSIARKNLADTKVLAPISGVVSSRTAEPGEHMSVGRVVLRIDDLSHVEAAAFIPAQYYSDVVPGETRFRLSVSGRDAGSHTVLYRSPTIDPVLRTFEIKGKVEGREGLAVPGDMANLTLVFLSRTGLAVPSVSVLNRAGNQVVFVIRDGQASIRIVETGLQNDGMTEILGGLESGEVVVTEGQTQLRDGMAVEIQ